MYESKDPDDIQLIADTLTPIGSGAGKIHIGAQNRRELERAGLVQKFANFLKMKIALREQCNHCGKGLAGWLLPEENNFKFCYHCGAQQE